MKTFRISGRFGMALCGAALLATVPVMAHHSAAMFDGARVIELKGTIKEFQWTNPHTWIQVNVPNEKGQMVEWSVEGGSPATLSRGGWKRSTFSPGDQVTIKVHPMRDGSAAGNFMGAKFADGRTVGNWDRAGGGSDY